MTSITKTFKWPMAHRLESHNGACRNIHGHNYTMEVTVEAKPNTKKKKSSEGMVVDFSYLKFVVNKFLIDPLDHAFAYNKNDPTSVKIAKYLKKVIDQKTMSFPFRLTAENMASHFMVILNTKFKTCKCGIICTKIKLYETDTSFTEVLLED